MKASVLIFTAILLFLAVGLTSCSDKKKSYDNPHTTILGKWEQVEIHHSSDPSDIQTYEPTGYFEFRPDGTMLWYDYIVEERSFEGKFWIEPTETLSNIYNPTRERKVWILSIECDEIGHCHSFYLIFYSQNRMGLSIAGIWPQIWITNIFERKK